MAYAIPSPPELSSPDVLDIYKQRLQTSLTNFNTTLHTFSCGIPDQGRFSSVRTCDDCYEAYENWLCGIVMPRCTDIPPNQQQSAQQNYSTHASVDQVVFSDAPIPDSVQPVIVRDHPGTSRTPQWSNAGLKNLSLPDDVSSPFPYAEVPPCGGVCHLVAASCPNLISWTCPIKGTIAASYGEAKLLEPNDIQGGNMPGPVGVEKWRSADRFGNVWCNSFEIEALLDVRANTAGRTGRSAGLAAGLWVLLLWQQALL